MKQNCTQLLITLDKADIKKAFGTFEALLVDERVSGCLNNFVYTTKTGYQVSLGRHRQGQAIGRWSNPQESYQFVFMSADNGRLHRRAYTWEQVRQFLSEGFVIGTEKHPGLKLWYVESKRNSRRQAKDIFVLPVESNKKQVPF